MAKSSKRKESVRSKTPEARRKKQASTSEARQARQVNASEARGNKQAVPALAEPSTVKPRAERQRDNAKMPKCFVIMPFGGGSDYKGGETESQYVYDQIIKPAVVEVLGNGEEQSVHIVREMEKHIPGNIPADIIKNLAEADFVIADLTGMNPNVYLELGIRYALKRSGTILMMQKDGRLPFNIGHMRSIFYSNYRWDSQDGCKDLGAALREMLDLMSRRKYPGDSPVFEILDSLNLGAHVQLDDPTSSVMPWSVYWERIKQVVAILGDLHTNGNFTPDLILGVSNGGLLFADTLLRQAYTNAVPFFALWANRPRREHYFSHPVGQLINTDLLKQLRKDLGRGEREPYEILLIDDIIGTTRTIGQAIDFVNDQCQHLNVNLTVFVLYSKAPDSELAPLIKYFPPSHRDPNFAGRFAQFMADIRTHYEFLPYEKEIHGDLQITETMRSSATD